MARRSGLPRRVARGAGRGRGFAAEGNEAMQLHGQSSRGRRRVRDRRGRSRGDGRGLRAPTRSRRFWRTRLNKVENSSEGGTGRAGGRTIARSSMTPREIRAVLGSALPIVDVARARSSTGEDEPASDPRRPRGTQTNLITPSWSCGSSRAPSAGGGNMRVVNSIVWCYPKTSEISRKRSR